LCSSTICGALCRVKGMRTVCKLDAKVLEVATSLKDFELACDDRGMEPRFRTALASFVAHVSGTWAAVRFAVAWRRG
jgi:hypothetical protein